LHCCPSNGPPATSTTLSARVVHHTFKKNKHYYISVRTALPPQGAPQAASADVWVQTLELEGKQNLWVYTEQVGWEPAKEGTKHPVLKGVSLQQGSWKTTAAARVRKSRINAKRIPEPPERDCMYPAPFFSGTHHSVWTSVSGNYRLRGGKLRIPKTCPGPVPGTSQGKKIPEQEQRKANLCATRKRSYVSRAIFSWHALIFLDQCPRKLQTPRRKPPDPKNMSGSRPQDIVCAPPVFSHRF
jgi:hypothetical protein